MTTNDLSLYRKTSDILALRHFFDSHEPECNVIIRVVPDFQLDFVKIRSHIISNIITATVSRENLIKLEQSNQVISYNVAKVTKIVKK